MSFSRRKFIICLDTALLIIFLLLLAPRLTGLAFHEILGLIFFIPLIIHLLIAWPWIQKSIRKFFNTPRRNRFNFTLNTILFILAITVLVSGSFISQVVMPALGIKTINDRSWRAVHNRTLNFTVLFVGLHVAINWRWIVSVFKKRVTAPKQSVNLFSSTVTTIILRTVVLIFAAGIVAFVLYSILGSPSASRLYRQNEIARFTPTMGHGVGQLLGEAFLIAVYVFVARKWLRLRF